MYKFWKKLTLLGEVLLFIPLLVLTYFISYFSSFKIDLLNNLASWFEKYISFLSPEQLRFLLFFWIFFIVLEVIWWAIKLFFFKERPNPMPYSNWIEKILAGSFPSLHSARTFSFFIFSCAFVNIYVAFWFLIFWFNISYSRVYLKKHYWIDICGGVVLSIIIFFMLYFLFM